MKKHRITWTDLPEAVTTWVESTLGSPVVEWRSQSGGWSPGTADRLVCADGSRAFLKAASPALNPHTPGLYRSEGTSMRHLGPDVPCAHLLAAFDDGEWVAILLEDIAGTHPVTPWRVTELRAVLEALTAVTEAGLADGSHDLPDAAATFDTDFEGFDKVRKDPPEDLDPWVAGRLDALAALGEAAVPAIVGNSLGHADLRGDNILIEANGKVRLVDWAYACRLAPWADGVMMAVDVAAHGLFDDDGRAVDPMSVIEPWALGLGANTDAITAVLVGMAGYYTDAARRPASPGLDGLREFQAKARDGAVGLLKTRIE